MSVTKRSRPTHPGTELARELRRHGMTAYQCALRLGLRPPRIYELCKGESPMTPVMALRLARLLGGDPERWLVLQVRWDLAAALRQHAQGLRAIVPVGCSSDGEIE